MYQEKPFCIFSETGPLKQVMLHRPGKELDRLTINNMDELLFDDLIWLQQAQKEHDNFADILRKEGCEVLYFQECLAEVIEDMEIRTSLIKDVFSFECLDRRISEGLAAAFMELPSDELASHLIAGYSKKEAAEICSPALSLMSHIETGGEFVIRPIPNLYFQRDPAITVGNGIIIGQMTFEARRREPLYWKYITNYHPRFKGMKILFGDKPDEVWPHKVEGGDLHVFSETAMAIGVSQRTAPTTVQRIGRNLAQNTPIRRIFAFEIPKERYCMHLDTVFTMVDKDAFTIFPTVIDVLKVWQLDYNDDGTLASLKQVKRWKEAIAETLGFDKIRVIEMKGKDQAETDREQWHDGCNTLAIAPGKVITYNRNVMSNKLLMDNGIEVIELDGAELGRGRGGPRCMSMPLNRHSVK
ncbi:MAG: arginine deiminase [Synergistaceae bacterium]|nr:arginine deiminase [Synergistaceae bacterium]